MENPAQKQARPKAELEDLIRSGFNLDSAGILLQVSGFVKKLVDENKWNFSLGDAEVTSAQIADPKELLGSILWQAEKDARRAFGDTYVDNQGSALGLGFIVDPESPVIGALPLLQSIEGAPRAPVVMFTQHVLYQLNAQFGNDNDAVPLDGLVSDFEADVKNGFVPFIPGSLNKPNDLSLGL